ncbi:hypothetical protein [Mesorhizobium sp. M7A.F.Ca.US.001.02.1.1]|uniref:hypothetical protein n=1 Tax=Mesorhizobium sp. M7A.F.Ca.US.001.02.1.1 TaxID=2496703 RepID=UPI000FD45FA9|nr:hypothetical protein [Mesorhizobium sp. M7A.F.Ca.US.001.02.1.1]RVA06543.1 hypothetical protein EN938_05890 [Mesorhizobium sp. M7A.F.Ca.US.001.02.1.1]
MATQDGIELASDQFAFYFLGEAGVEANELGTFLQRAATVARREGAELRVAAIEAGSLAVIIRAVRLARAANAIRDEFSATPIKTTAATAALVTLVVGALVRAMSPETSQPLAKAGAEMVEKRQVERIEIRTHDETIVVMDPDRAIQVRQVMQEPKGPRLLPATEVSRLMEEGREGKLTGRSVEVDGEVHFRPDGYRYLVPVNMSSEAAAALIPGVHFQISADLLTHNGQPDSILIHKATPID